MATTKTIGATGRDYATLTLYAAYLDGLNTLTDAQIGDVYNDAEITESAAVSITGFTSDATNTWTIKAASGQGFADHANKLTNALKYNQSNGAAIKFTGTYTFAISAGVAYGTIQGLQFLTTQNACDGVRSNLVANMTWSGCLMQGPIQNNAYNGTFFIGQGATSKLINCIGIVTGTATNPGMKATSGGNAYGCTVVRGSNRSAAGTGFASVYGTFTLTNCAAFNFTNDTSGTISATTCATDDASPTTGFTGSLTYANQFVGTDTSGSPDFRTKAGANLIDAGTTDATNMPTDIVGTTRPQGAAYDIGCWELASSGFVKQVGSSFRLAGNGGGLAG